jgi:hypothetical protein
MPQDFETFLVKDDRLNVKSSVGYEVFKGAQQITYQNVVATSADVSQHVYNVIVPSQNVLVDRNVRWECSIPFQFTITNNSNTNAQRPLWGRYVCMQPFPLNQLCTTMTGVVNNNSVTIQSKEIMPFILKMLDKEALNDWQGTTPSYPDNVWNLKESEAKPSNAISGYENVGLDGLQPRGSFKLDYYNSYGPNAGANKWTVDELVGANLSQTIYGQITVSEPLFMSPFLFNAYAKNPAAVYGINNLILTMNMGSANNLFNFPVYELGPRTSSTVANTTVTDIRVAYNQCSVRLALLTPHTSDIKSLRNIVPYMTLNKVGFKCPQTAAPQVSANGALSTVVETVESGQMNINQIPDKFLIGVRPSAKFLAKPTACQYGQFFLPIVKFEATFLNNSGLLSTANSRQLWNMSRANGLQQSWTEWSGRTMYVNGQQNTAYGVVENGTLGGFLILAPAKDLQIVDEFFAPGSAGQISFQCKVSYQNHTTLAFEDGDLELVIIPQQSGLFVLEAGSSALYQALLTKELVNETTLRVMDGQNKAFFSSQVTRQVGGSFWDDIKSGINEVSQVVKPIMDIAGPIASVAKMAMGPSGGGETGGRKAKKKLMRHM